MDERVSYQALFDLLSEEGDPSFSPLSSAMAFSSRRREASNDPALFQAWKRMVLYERGEEINLRSLKSFLSLLRRRNPSWKGADISDRAYRKKALEEEATVTYSFLETFFQAMAKAHPNDFRLASEAQKLQRTSAGGGFGASSPLFEAFLRAYEKAEKHPMNGYVFATTFLFELGGVSQAILTRFGQSLWETFYENLDLFAPARGEATSFDELDASPRKGESLSSLLPFYLALGYRFDLVYQDRRISLEFPYRGMEMTDPKLFVDGVEKTYEFLDDLWGGEALPNKKTSEVFRSSKEVVARKPEG